MEDNKEFLKCFYCDIEDGTVTKVLDPFLLEVCNEEVEVNLCPNCYNDRYDEI